MFHLRQQLGMILNDRVELNRLLDYFACPTQSQPDGRELDHEVIGGDTIGFAEVVTRIGPPLFLWATLLLECLLFVVVVNLLAEALANRVRDLFVTCSRPAFAERNEGSV